MRAHLINSQDLEELLRSHGKRVTLQRLAVYATVKENRNHLTAEDVYRQVKSKIPNISLATVYKALGDLREVGKLKVLEVAGKLRYEGNLEEDHHHLVCDRCNRVVDVQPDEGTTPALSDAQAGGFTLISTEVTFRGICPSCREHLAPGGASKDQGQDLQVRVEELVQSLRREVRFIP